MSGELTRGLLELTRPVNAQICPSHITLGLHGFRPSVMESSIPSG